MQGNSDPGGTTPAVSPESPTIVRTSSSSARRMQASDEQPRVASAISLPRQGDTIGTFLLQESIGAGGMGAVYRARDLQLDRFIALKLLPPDQAVDPELVQRFYQEGRSAAQLDHENIARVYSIGQDGPHHYIAFEYIEGITIRRRVDSDGPLPVGEAVDIALQIANALVHAAERGVVHRDIKPSNIILTPLGRAKLVDMGLARRFEREADHGLTQSGMTLGTFDYISPEQARDPRDVDVRSDLYSLGCTLFHMLTGRPPFPEGTVLQKLLQHQEEPPPEIRDLNPSVPAELSRLITRLLAKDRDRRVQSPEQLVRDLLMIAGQLGLAVMVPERHAWMEGRRPMTWQHHLIWISPALGFLVVIAGLLLWARELTNPIPSQLTRELGRMPRASEEGSTVTPATPATLPRARNPATLVDSAPAPGRSITARAVDDLVALISAAPPRSIITLAEDGPYQLGGLSTATRNSSTLAHRDVTIRAEAGARPVLRFAPDARLSERANPSLLAFSGGNVTIEGLTFEFDEQAPEGTSYAISVEDTDLTIRGCMFRHPSQTAAEPGKRRVAVRTRTVKTADDRGDLPPPLFIESCHFDGGQVAVLAQGPADLTLGHCTIGPGAPSIWIDNRQALNPSPVDLRLRNSSLLAASSPVFEIEGALSRVQLDNCVVAPAGNALPTLVAIDNARNLIWRGRSNLYGKMRSFLESTRRSGDSLSIADFGRWKDGELDIRETESNLRTAQVWRSSQPLQNLRIDLENPTQAFELVAEVTGAKLPGAQRGPFGAQLGGGVRASSAMPESTASIDSTDAPPPRVAAKSAGSEQIGAVDRAVGESPPIASLSIPREPDQEVSRDDLDSLPSMPPMTTSPTFEPTVPVTGQSRKEEPVAANQGSLTARPAETPAADAGYAARKKDSRNVDHGEDLIRSAEQFVDSLSKLSSRGGTLRIAREADLELSAVEIPAGSSEGGGNLQIEAEQGGVGRPILRFRPSRLSTRFPASWATMFNVRQGAVKFVGIDFVVQLPDDDGPDLGRLAAFGIQERTSLTFTNCTITVAGRPGEAAAIVLHESQPTGKRSDTEASATSTRVRLEDSFLRSGGDGIVARAAIQLDFECRNVAIATDGSLLHAMGSPRVDRSRASLKLKLERVVARTRGGLAFLESVQDDAELPLTQIDAFSSILSTAGQALFRVDGGQGQMDRSRDRIIWKADKVAYDQITTYRRDQVLQTGVPPVDYSRSDWRTAFEPEDESPLIDSVQFVKAPERWRTACSLTESDFRVDAQSPAYGRGPDLARIPSPPRADL